MKGAGSHSLHGITLRCALDLTSTSQYDIIAPVCDCFHRVCSYLSASGRREVIQTIHRP